MKVLILAAVLAFATTVYSQNPYEYVDDDLFAKVGEIIFNYDQKVAASRSTGDVRTPSYPTNNNYQPQVQQEQYQRGNTGVVGGSQQGYPTQQVQNTYRPPQQVQTNYQNSYRPTLQANSGVVGGYQKMGNPEQNNYNGVRRQREFNFQQAAPQVRQVQQVQQVQRVQQTPYTYQPPQVHQQTATKNSFGYTLSQPEVMERVAEFHFTDGQDSFGKQGGYKQGGYQQPSNTNTGFVSTGTVEANRFRYA